MKNPDAEARRQRILAEIRAVPRGAVCSYGAIARRARAPRAARWVARILADHGGDALPWHRIVRADGRIAFPQGSAAYHEQCQRLRAEGVPVEHGRVQTETEDGRWLDKALWASPVSEDDI